MIEALEDLEAIEKILARSRPNQDQGGQVSFEWSKVQQVKLFIITSNLCILLIYNHDKPEQRFLKHSAVCLKMIHFNLLFSADRSDTNIHIYSCLHSIINYIKLRPLRLGLINIQTLVQLLSHLTPQMVGNILETEGEQGVLSAHTTTLTWLSFGNSLSVSSQH